MADKSTKKIHHWNTVSKWLYGIQNTTAEGFPCYEEAVKSGNLKNSVDFVSGFKPEKKRCWAGCLYV